MTPEDAEDFMRKWTTDASGNYVLRGLTHAETVWYEEEKEKSLEHRKDHRYFPWPSAAERHKDQARWLALHEKHEAARIAGVIGGSARLH